MNTKIVTVILMIITLQACSATHSSVERGLSLNAKTVLKIVEGNYEIKQKWIADKNRERVIERVIKGGDELSMSNPGKYETKIEQLIVDLAENRFHSAGQWKNQNDYIANKVWENNAMIDRERSDLGNSHFRQVQGHGVIQYDLSGNGIIHEGQSQSGMRMREGLSPIGPDGLPMVLCRILRSPNASFFELTKTESIAFIKLASESLSRDEVCMSHSASSKEYWKKRSVSY